MTALDTAQEALRLAFEDGRRAGRDEASDEVARLQRELVQARQQLAAARMAALNPSGWAKAVA